MKPHNIVQIFLHYLYNIENVYNICEESYDSIWTHT